MNALLQCRRDYYAIYHNRVAVIWTKVFLLYLHDFVRAPVRLFSNLFTTDMVREARRCRLQVLTDDGGVKFVIARATRRIESAGGVASSENTDLPPSVYGIICNHAPEIHSYVRVQLTFLEESNDLRRHRFSKIGGGNAA
jgi:hypothetical protein